MEVYMELESKLEPYQNSLLRGAILNVASTSGYGCLVFC